jgi:hypothetical protein
MRLEIRRLITLKRKNVRRLLSNLYPLVDELQEQGRISDISEAVLSNHRLFELRNCFVVTQSDKLRNAAARSEPERAG